MNEFSPDADNANADWTKQAWDFPPYKSANFLALVPDLESFRKSPAYRAACERGLIHDDEWVADWCTPSKPKKPGVHVHIH